MGSRKRIVTQQRTELKKNVAFARLNNLSTSPRKMRLVINLIRNMSVNKALAILKYNKQHASLHVKKLLTSVLANWQLKNENKNIKNIDLYIYEIKVDSGPMLKRTRPAPQGRGYRIRKRSNHISITLGTK